MVWPAVAGAQVNAVRSSLKVRPTDSVSAASSIELRAGKNEFEAFQVVIAGGASGRTSVNVTASTFVREGGSETIAASEVRFYREHTINFTTRSNPEGASGDWRDALIPKVEDGVAVSSPTGSEVASTNETRNGFPFNITANKNEVVWVDIHVPASQVAGRYTSTLTVTASGVQLGTIGVTLLVHSFSIPATSSLPTAFGLAGDQLCRAHGDVLNNFCPSLSRIRTWARLYARFLQDHRITAWLPDDPNPTNYSAAATDYVNGYAALINGTDFSAQRRLKNADGSGAKSTTVMFPWYRSADSETTFKAKLGQFITMTQNNGWFSKAFHYGKPDEPTTNCTSWGTVRNQGIWAHAVNSSFRIMATGNIGDANACLGATSASNDLDIIDPVLNHMEVVSGYETANHPLGNRRADYNTFLSGANNQLWMYQSCMSHGCTDNNGSAAKNFPNLMVDSTGVQNRSEPWMHYIYNARAGMLYYETALLLPTAWNNNGIWSSDFGGQGDGTLLYPGTPAKIGGTTHIPVASIRLKLLREGLEDYEYLLKCETAKGSTTAQNIALGMFPSPSMVAASDFNGTTRNPSLYTSRLETKRTDLLTCILPTPQLTVSLSGSGTVTSSVTGLSCSGSTCTGSWSEGTRMTLTATPTSGSTFTGWSGGGCSGTGQCTVNLFSATSVTATFSSGSATLTASKIGAGAGSVSSSPAGISCPGDCSETYVYGTNVTLTPSAGANSYFAGWSGACSGTGSCVVSMTAAKSVGATFNLNSYSVTVSRQGTGSGAVSSSPAGINCGSDCSEPYVYGTSVTLTATPSTGSTFAGWSGGGCSGTGSCVVSVTAATTVTATFTAQQYQLTAAKAGTGSGTVTSTPVGISCGTDCTELYNYGTSVTLTASAASGSTFAGWSGGGCSGTGTCTVSVTAALTVTATFNTTPTSAVLTAQKNGTGSGTVTSSPAGIDCGATCSASYPVNTSVTLTASAASGSTFAGWSGGGCTGTGTCVVNLTVATTVTATFNTTPSSYSLSVAKTGTGSGSVDSSPSGIACGGTCSATFAAGTTVTLTATPAQGSTFGGWSGACSGGQSTCTVTMNAATSISALFNPVGAPASRTTLFADDFKRTTGLGSSWQVWYGGYTTSGTAAVSGTPPVNGNWASVVPSIGTDDYVVEAVMTIPSGSFSSGVAARGNPLSFDSDLYAAQLSTDGNLSLYRRNSWTWTALGSYAAGIIPGQAYTLKLVVTGSNPVHLEAWLDGTQRISTEDSSTSRITSGLPGLENYASNVEYDSFSVYRAPLFTDSFNRTTGLGASWQVWYGGYTTNGSNAVSSTPPSNGNWASVVPALGTDDYTVEAVMTIPTGSYSSGVVARGDPTTFDSDLYAAQISTDGNLSLYRRNGWNWTALGSASVGIVAGRSYTVKLVVTGSDPVHLEAWIDGALQISTEDSSVDRILTGVPGIENYAANVTFDSFTVTEAPMFVDSFNRTTGLGNGWTVVYGDYATDGEAVSATPPINGNWAQANAVSSIATDYAVETSILVPTGSTYSGVVARSVGTEFDRDLYSAQISTDGNVNIYRRNDWTWTLLGSAHIGIVANQSYRLKFVVTGSAVVHLEAWVDGIKRVEVDDSSASRHLAGGAGLACYHSGVRYDNLSVSSQ